MALRDAGSIARKWSQRLQAAGQEMEAGINAVTVAPGVLAARKQDTMRARLIAAIDSGKWQRNVAAVPLATWQQRMIRVGIPRALQGAAESEQKVFDFFQRFIPFLQRAKAEIAQMPNATDEQRKQRMVRMFDLMKQFGRGGQAAGPAGG